MEKSKFQDLPPLKRYRMMHQEKEQNNVTHQILNSSDSSSTPLCLPAKKRKEIRDSQPFPSNSTVCLPAKKRIWAFQPFDLNLEYDPSFDSQKQVLDNKGTDKGKAVEDKAPENAENEENLVEYDGIVCAICDSTDGDPSDPIVLCDGCDLMVHTSCYGHPFTKGIPDGDWFCAVCLASRSKKVARSHISCSLCPVAGGALKTTENGKWAHVVCALYVPEVFFHDPEGRRGIDCTHVPKRRWQQKCYICKTKNGCCIDCSEPKCPLAFHVTCGLKEELCIEYREGKSKGAIVAGFCRTHTDLWIKQQQTGKFKIVARDDEKK